MLTDKAAREKKSAVNIITSRAKMIVVLHE